MLIEIIQAIVYGLVQGICEFLPISSTAHLIIVPYIFHWNEPGLTFDVFLHLGTLFAVISFFYRDWIKYIILLWQKKSFIFLYLIIALIPAGLAGFFFEDKIETTLRDPIIIVFTLVIFGFLLFIVDELFRHTKNIDSTNWWNSLLIGVAQAIALIPGVSRSGVTMTAAMALGFKRTVAARLSFLIATPIMIGAVAIRIKDLFILPKEQLFNGLGVIPAVIAFVVALLSGYLAIKYLLQFLGKHGFLPFVIYRLAVAVIILIFYFFVQ